MKVLVLNGVNLNMLGKRETELYGSETLSDLETRLTSLNKDVDLEFFQSNSEEDIINKIHSHKEEKYDFGIFNFGTEIELVNIESSIADSLILPKSDSSIQVNK